MNDEREIQFNRMLSALKEIVSLASASKLLRESGIDSDSFIRWNYEIAQRKARAAIVGVKKIESVIIIRRNA